MSSIKTALPEILYGERVLLRLVCPQDSEKLHHAIVTSYDLLNKWVVWASQTKEDCDSWCRKAYEKSISKEEFNVLICDRNTGEILGGTGVHSINWNFKSFEIGYWGVSKFAGNGFITESVKLLTQYLLKEFEARRIWLTVDDRNDKSINLAERCGFKLEGVLHNERLGPDGNLRNTRIYAIWT